MVLGLQVLTNHDQSPYERSMKCRAALFSEQFTAWWVFWESTIYLYTYILYIKVN